MWEWLANKLGYVRQQNDGVESVSVCVCVWIKFYNVFSIRFATYCVTNQHLMSL